MIKSGYRPKYTVVFKQKSEHQRDWSKNGYHPMPDGYWIAPEYGSYDKADMEKKVKELKNAGGEREFHYKIIKVWSNE